jgi:tRNA (guanine-N7-)-methyltransferase
MHYRHKKIEETDLNLLNLAFTPFSNSLPIHLEIGCGRGQFIIQLATLNPNINFIAIEKNFHVFLHTYKKVANLNLNNLQIYCLDATNLVNFLQDTKIDKLYLNFSDPWFKARHMKRRLTSSNFNQIYLQILKKNSIIRYKSDNLEFYEYSLKSLSCDFDIIESGEQIVQDEIISEYEQRFRSQNKPIYYIVALKRS